MITFKANFIITVTSAMLVCTPAFAGLSVKDVDIRGVKLGMTPEQVKAIHPSATQVSDGFDISEPDTYIRIDFTSSQALKRVVKEVRYCQKFQYENGKAQEMEQAILEKVKQKYGAPDDRDIRDSRATWQLNYGVTAAKLKSINSYYVTIDGEKISANPEDHFLFLRAAVGKNIDHCNPRSNSGSGSFGGSDWGLYLWLRDGPTGLKNYAAYQKERRIAEEQKAKATADSVKARF